jgi:hypothetical protein
MDDFGLLKEINPDEEYEDRVPGTLIKGYKCDPIHLNHHI